MDLHTPITYDQLVGGECEGRTEIIQHTPDTKQMLQGQHILMESFDTTVISLATTLLQEVFLYLPMMLLSSIDSI